MKIPFNKPHLTGNEMEYVEEAIRQQKLSGNGFFTKSCQSFIEERYGIKKALLTHSCTAALEMAAILLNIQPEDEVIMPSYTFVSTANAFVLRGANIVFCDSKSEHPNIDEEKVEQLITKKTKAIVAVHYGGVSCNMEYLLYIAKKYNLSLVEDSAQAIDSTYTFNNGTIKSLGSIGNLSTFSFHETKNISSGEGGLLGINDTSLIARAEIIWEKGTNRSAFFRGEIKRYEWVDIGSSFLPSEVTAAFLMAQLKMIDIIQSKRKSAWEFYNDALQNKSDRFTTPNLPAYSSNNAHLFYLIFNSPQDRNAAIKKLAESDILAVFHYVSLHSSSYYKGKYTGQELIHCDKFSECLLRLPLYCDLTIPQQQKVIDALLQT